MCMASILIGLTYLGTPVAFTAISSIGACDGSGGRVMM